MDAQKTKAKNTPIQHNRWIFLGLWLLGHGLAWLPFMIMTETSLDDTVIAFAIFIGIFLGGITSATQYLLIHRQFGHNIKWWMPLSTIAWIIGAITLYSIDLFNTEFTSFNFTIQMLVLAGPAILVQLFLLRKYIKQSWLWGLANFAGLATFATGLVTLSNGDTNFLTVAISYGLFASATGMTLLWLFGMAQTPTKQKAHSIERLIDNNVDYIHDEVLSEPSQTQTQRLQ